MRCGLWLLSVLACSAHRVKDPEGLLVRAAESLNESMQYLTSYSASTRITPAHSELVSIIAQLEPLERRLDQIATASSHRPAD